MAALLAPGWTADHNELADFNPNLRNASLFMAGRFGDADVLATTAGTLSQEEDPRLMGAYAVLAAPARHHSRTGNTSDRCAAASWCSGSTSATASTGYG